MVDAILEALKKTSKGSLQYDRSWYFEGRSEGILRSLSSLTRLHNLPTEPEHHLEQENEKEIELKKPVVLETNASPTKHADVIQDTCFEILDYEEQRKKKVQETVLAFKSEVDSFGEHHSHQTEQQMALLIHNLKVQNQRRNDQLAQLQFQELLEVREQQSKFKEHQKTRKERLNERMREMEERQRQLLENELRRKREMEEMRHQLLGLQSQLQSMTAVFAEALAGCVQPDYLERKPEDYLQALVSAQQSLHSLLDSEVSLQLVQQAQSTFLAVKANLARLHSDIGQANTKHREVEQKKEIALPAETDTQLSPVLPQESTFQTDDPGKDTKLEQTKKELGILSGCVDVEGFTTYEMLMKSIRDWEETFKPLESDPSLKKLQFEMKKAVNTPVNAISSQSGQQLKDKLDRLVSLLLGRPVPGRSGISCQSHPQALHFCTHLLAKKIVSQAESQVSSHQNAAFPLAAVAVGLWARFPKFGELLLAQLYVRCPYLLPIYHQQKKGMDEKEFHTLLGYTYENGEMEKQDQFLKRMGGIVCFYAALLQTSAPPGYAAVHPHGIQHGWQFLSRMINLRPRFDITATVLFNFLEVAGSALYNAYGKQMHKLVCYLRGEYVTHIRRVTAGESLGPVSRLETFLADTARSGRIVPPAGTLTAGFWNT